MLSVYLTQSGGILGPIAKLLGEILNGIFTFLGYFGIENAGLSIVLFTFIVNALMIPLTIKQQKFSKLSTRMNPELVKINAKYKGKKDEVSMRKQQAETQAVYQKYGANPTAGCLPLIITLPIMFALYRVIYNVPAYVDSIKDIYETIALAVKDTSPDYVDKMTEIGKQFSRLNMDKWPEAKNSLTNEHMIDILAQFRTSNWDELQKSFPTIADVIQTNSGKIMNINTLGSLNIADTPSVKSLVSLLIPVLAVVTQFVQTKMMTASVNTNNDDNPTASSMKAMNNIMPFVSGIFCMTFPIGIGLYWIAGNVFRIIQQFFVNKYMDTVDMDHLIEKNLEKAKKRQAKLGIDPTKTSLEEVAKTRTASVKEIANNSVSKPKINQKSENRKSDVSYEPGSISSIANMLGNKKNQDKGEK